MIYEIYGMLYLYSKDRLPMDYVTVILCPMAVSMLILSQMVKLASIRLLLNKF